MTIRDPLDGINLQEIAGKLGFMDYLPIPFAPPNIYPMSAPKFVSSPGAERTRPAGTRLGIYVHVPFCNYACNFCFYAKRVGDEESTMARYVRALSRELEWSNREPSSPNSMSAAGHPPRSLRRFWTSCSRAYLRGRAIGPERFIPSSAPRNPFLLSMSGCSAIGKFGG